MESFGLRIFYRSMLFCGFGYPPLEQPLSAVLAAGRSSSTRGISSSIVSRCLFPSRQTLGTAAAACPLRPQFFRLACFPHSHGGFSNFLRDPNRVNSPLPPCQPPACGGHQPYHFHSSTEMSSSTTPFSSRPPPPQAATDDPSSTPRSRSGRRKRVTVDLVAEDDGRQKMYYTHEDLNVLHTSSWFLHG